jgi:alpha-tubulin suppressor-like RCC1 family protein
MLRRRMPAAQLRAVLGVVVPTALVASLTSPLAAALLAYPASTQPLQNIIKAWGFNEDGELGDGTTQNSTTPIAVNGLRDAVAIASGSHHSLALIGNGTVMAWGENVYGQLGDGTTDNSAVPVPVSGLSEVAAVASGEDHSLALLKDGTVMAWGRNSSGQLGDGSAASSDVPVAVKGLSRVAAISAGGSFSLALLTDGTVMAWGENFHGQLGDGTTTNSDIPVTVGGVTGVTAISAGFRHSVALLSGGTAVAWGENEYGQLGDGTESQRDVPVAVRKLSGVEAVSAGKSQSLAVVAGGAVVAWGDNEEGQLGDGNHAGPERCGAPPVFACSKAPVAVRGLSHVTAIAAGSHSLALLANGAVLAWGPNNAGQLGDGTRTGPEICGPSASACSTIPVLSSTHGIAVAIAAGAEFSLALGPSPPGPPPELGRCVRVARPGAYRGMDARCVALTRMHKGNFEWLPGPGSNPKFTEHLMHPELETIGRNKLDCQTAVFQGEYTGPKTETITHTRLAGCLDVALDMGCQTNPLEEGVIEASLRLEGDLGFIASGARPKVGWEVTPKPPATSLISFECGSGATVVAEVLEGAVVGRVSPVNRMVSAFELQYRQSKGRQIPEFLAGSERHVLTLAATALMGETTSEQAGLRTGGDLSGEEALEIKAKV